MPTTTPDRAHRVRSDDEPKKEEPVEVTEATTVKIQLPKDSDAVLQLPPELDGTQIQGS